MIARISSVVASRISSASLRSTLMAPRRANSRMAGDSVRARAGVPSSASLQRAGARPRAGRRAAAGRSGRARSSSTGCPTASHMRRTWRLRPSRIVSSISCSPSRRTPRRRGAAVLELDAVAQAPQRRVARPGRRRASRGRSSAPRSAGASGGWRARRRWSAGSGRCCRRPGGRPDTGAARCAGTSSTTVGRPWVSLRRRDDADRLVQGVGDARLGPAQRAAVDAHAAAPRRRRGPGR